MQGLQVLPPDNVPELLEGVPVPVICGHIKARRIQVTGVQAHAHPGFVIHMIDYVPAQPSARISVRRGMLKQQA